jgi:hypothetical protein
LIFNLLIYKYFLLINSISCFQKILNAILSYNDKYSIIHGFKEPITYGTTSQKKTIYA